MQIDAKMQNAQKVQKNKNKKLSGASYQIKMQKEQNIQKEQKKYKLHLRASYWYFILV